MVPPRVYELWWRLTEKCSTKTGDFNHIRWFQLRDASAFTVRNTAYGAYWYKASNAIVVVGRQRLDGQLIRHEMLHALTGRTHPREYFLEKCGGIVACQAECLKETGDVSRPPSDAPVIATRKLDVLLEVVPSSVSMAIDSGWITISVSARNPSHEAAWIDLRPVAPGGIAATTFGYTLKCLDACGETSVYQYVNSGRVGIAGEQVLRYQFDKRLAAGRYAVRGFFNTDTTASAEIYIAP